MNRKSMIMMIAYGIVAFFLVGIWQLSAGKEKEVYARTCDTDIAVSTGGAIEICESGKTKLELTKKKEQKRKKQKKKKIRKSEKEYKYNISRSDRMILEQIVEAEAGGQDIKGRILVANVVLNRVRQNGYPNTVKGVVYAHSDGCYQFSPVADGRIHTVIVSTGTKKAVKKALMGVDYSKGAQYFMCRSSSSAKNIKWFDTHLTKVFTYGAHEFFRK